jgi:glycosyltransferase involved in cell wall biosynthesis
MRVALVHYWLLSMRGGEKVLEALGDLYPDADIFTLVYDEKNISSKLKAHKIKTSFLQKIPGSIRHYQSLLPLMPYALENIDLTDYDLIISSESGPAKGIIPRPDALHVCYCHSPMRYLWDHYHLYRDNAGLAGKLAMPLMATRLRQWDVSTSVRVDQFVANSRHVANRIRKYYRRDAQIIHPPVAVDEFAPSKDIGDFYLCAGQLVKYKRVDLAVAAFTRMKKKLVVIGEGEELARLRSIAGPTITFMGHQPFSVLKDCMAACKALVFPGQEDFGIVPVEVMASGRPVIAFGSGGALDTVVDGWSGVLFNDQTVEGLVDAIDRYETQEARFIPAIIRNHARQFSETTFKSKISLLIEGELRKNHGYHHPAEEDLTRSAIPSFRPELSLATSSADGPRSEVPSTKNPALAKAL